MQRRATYKLSSCPKEVFPDENDEVMMAAAAVVQEMEQAAGSGGEAFPYHTLVFSPAQNSVVPRGSELPAFLSKRGGCQHLLIRQIVSSG